MRNLFLYRFNPGHYFGRRLDAGRDARKHRHVSNVADRASGFGAGSVGVPEGGADRHR